MSQADTTRRRRFAALLCACAAIGAGCQTRGQTGAVAGAGVGALIGQAVGGNTTATLIGAGIGTGVGYIIGNEQDKQAAEQRQVVTTQETYPLAGTTWQVVSWIPTDTKKFRSAEVSFYSNGTMRSTETLLDGQNIEKNERFRIVGQTLIVTGTGFLVNSRFSMRGNELILDTERVSVVLRRVAN